LEKLGTARQDENDAAVQSFLQPLRYQSQKALSALVLLDNHDNAMRSLHDSHEELALAKGAYDAARARATAGASDATTQVLRALSQHHFPRHVS